MSERTHSICRECWEKRNPGLAPYTIINKYPIKCCFCGKITRDGIFVREDPTNTLCWRHNDTLS